MKLNRINVIAASAMLVLAVLAGCSNKKNEPVGKVKDACGNEYNYVKMGDQYWMAENMRCNKYDSWSELSGETIDVSKEAVYTPYYTDASDQTQWSSAAFSGGLSSGQVSKLGYLYNWAAAVGIATEIMTLKQYDAFENKRQGICPNGWHVPTSTEWAVLKDFIENRDGKGKNTAGKHLKTTSGWYGNKKNDDIYSFAALPSGRSNVVMIDAVGKEAHFWTATPCVLTIETVTDEETKETYKINKQSDFFFMASDRDILDSNHNSKTLAKSVRCVKD